MQWIHDYQLFLFDFDGLLVNTEEIHYLSYQHMTAARGVKLTWDFNRYCQAAHYDADALKKQIYVEFPMLYAQEPDWTVLYSEKKQALKKLFQEGAVNLMPGVEKLLKKLQEAKIGCCVVTHSPDDLVQLVRKQHPILDTIPHWVTREHYSNPKPHSECYLKAIDLFAKPEYKVIGFEDTPRGLNALMGTHATPILISKADYPEIPDFIRKGAKHFRSFENINFMK